MRRLVFLFLVILSTSALAHEVQLITQHLKINKQHETGWQTDALAKAVLSPKYEFGLHGTYLERFDLYENRLGAFLIINPIQNLTFELRYLKGEHDVEILARDQYTVSMYHALSAGISPYIIYQNALYSITHLQTLRVGLEIEKIANVIIIPSVMIGQAQFDDPTEVKEVNNFGLKVIYYVEQQYSLQAFAYKGIEAAQVIVGRSNQTVETKTIGAGAGYYVIPDIKAEVLVDYTDYKELNNQFLTTTLNLVWAF